MKIQIKSSDIRQTSKKMSPEELQQHLKNSRKGVGVQKSKKAYSRKAKHSKRMFD